MQRFLQSTVQKGLKMRLYRGSQVMGNGPTDLGQHCCHQQASI